MEESLFSFQMDIWIYYLSCRSIWPDFGAFYVLIKNIAHIEHKFVALFITDDLSV